MEGLPDETTKRVSWHKIVAALAAAAILAFLALSWAVFSPLDKSVTETREVLIETGSGLHEIASVLKERGIIRSRNLFVLYVRYFGDATALKAGRYKFSPAMNISRIAKMLVQGLAESEDKQVVIPEGSNIWEIEKKFIEAGLAVLPGDVVREWRKQEGYLFPDTYRFDPRYEKAADVIKKMQDNFWSKAGRQDSKVVIIASLLEKEAKTKEDMELVSGIIKRRLEKEMLLQIDASVAYGACLIQAAKKNYSIPCDVTQEDIVNEIKIDQPYNTYMWPGLPAGPISNPGLVALQAAANPKDSEYWFYLSTRDGSRLIYSKTIQEHLSNRRKYLGF